MSQLPSYRRLWPELMVLTTPLWALAALLIWACPR